MTATTPPVAPPEPTGRGRSTRVRRARIAAVTAGCLLALSAAAVAALVIGSSRLSAADAVTTLFGGGSAAQRLIVVDLRLPRVVGGLLVGAALGLAGALTQTFARNPLATPDILGVTSGASLGAVAAIVLGGGTFAVAPGLLSLGLPAMAGLGALVTAAVVYGLAWRGGVSSYRLILIGIGATATLTGLTSYLVARAQITEAGAAAQWLVGSLSGISWASVWPVLIAVVVLVPVAWSQVRDLSTGELGDEIAVGLGVALQRHRLVVIACAVGLTAAAVSASGPIEFVAFVAPQVALRLARASRPPLAASALVGALIVVGGDVLARGVLPGQLPVGIVTAFIGAPYLIWLLTRRPTRGETS